MKPKVKITITEARQLQEILKETGVSFPDLNHAIHVANKKPFNKYTKAITWTSIAFITLAIWACVFFKFNN